MDISNYSQIIKNIKEAILSSRYQVAITANKEMLFLYFDVGKIISEKVASEKWGSKTIEKLSSDLQNDLKGLRGFSATNLKRMKHFSDEWSPYFHRNIIQNEISPSITDEMKVSDNECNIISPLLTVQLGEVQNEFSSLLTTQFVEHFFKLGFSPHYEIIIKQKV